MTPELLISWLNDAYAMEQAQIRMLERFSTDFEPYPDIRSELRQHLIETRQQLDDIRECLTTLGVAPRAAQRPTPIQGLYPDSSHVTFKEDELVKNLLVLHACEHYEHITYLALAEGARQASQDEIADICERIAEEEMAMAEWVEEQVPVVVAICAAATHEQA